MQSQVPLRKLERDIHAAPGYSPSNFRAAVYHWDNVHSLPVHVLTAGPKIAKAALYLADPTCLLNVLNLFCVLM